MTKTQAPTVRIYNGALDEDPNDRNKIVLRGSIDTSCLADLRVDDYQRERQPISSTFIRKIVQAFALNDSVADVELGMRGGRVVDKDGEFVLRDPVYIIDGLQRITALQHFLKVNPDATRKLGAMIHFNTDEAWERRQFHVANANRLRVSSNVHLKNLRNESNAILTLFGMTTNDKSFVLNDRVSWAQRMRTGDLTQATVLTKVCSRLHSHKISAKQNGIAYLVAGLDRFGEQYGLATFRDNVRTFFDLVDDCYGIRNVQYNTGAVHMKVTFLCVLARFFSDHAEFWKGAGEKSLFVDADTRRKLAGFAIKDPYIANLAASQGKASGILYNLLVQHMNKGKRKDNKLTARESAGLKVKPTAIEDRFQ